MFVLGSLTDQYRNKKNGNRRWTGKVYLFDGGSRNLIAEVYGDSAEEMRARKHAVASALQITQENKNMTMPHLMNCSHQADGWCLECVKREHDNREIEKREEFTVAYAAVEWLCGRITDADLKAVVAQYSAREPAASTEGGK